MTLLSGLAAAAALALAFAAPAMATPYSQSINETGVGMFDRIEAFIASPSTGLSMSAFSDGSWTSTAMTPRWSVASGDALSNLTYNVNFDFASTPFTYDFFAFNGNTLLDSARFTYDQGLSWVDPIPDAALVYASDKNAAPEPATLSVVGAALIGFGVMKRRRNQSRAT